MQKKSEIFLKGLISENPVMALMIGLCPVLACSTNAFLALGIGVTTAVVLTAASFIVSVFRRWIGESAKIYILILIAATLASIADMVLQAYLPLLSTELGIFVPLITVNCLILSRAADFACSNTVTDSLVDSIGAGTGFALAATVVGVVREILGAGTIFNSSSLSLISEPALIMILPPGAFIIMGVLSGLWNLALKNREKGYSSCSSCGMYHMCHPVEQDKCSALEKAGR